MQKRIVLFDVDGTLVHAGSAAARAFASSFTSLFSVDIKNAEVSCAGRTDGDIHQDYARKLLGRLLSHPESEQLTEHYLSALEQELALEEEYVILPGVREICEQLSERSNVVLGLQTGNFASAARLKLRHGALDGYFPFGGFACDSSVRSELVAKAIVRAHERDATSRSAPVFVIGDTPFDIEAGRANNCITIAVATGSFSVSELEAYSPDVVLESLEDVNEILQGLEDRWCA